MKYLNAAASANRHYIGENHLIVGHGSAPIEMDGFALMKTPEKLGRIAGHGGKAEQGFPAMSGELQR